jgi:ectoine hydroxylase-related dioxygenase (phytanoyl-CoA dioxygenase family)
VIKVIFYLDPVDKDTGCLRVIPGSHRPPLNTDVVPLTRQRSDPSVIPFAVSPRDVPCFPLESQPGDVVFFNQKLWHAAFGGRTGRRMFTLNFAAKPTTDAHIAYLQRVYQGNLRNIERMQFTQRERVHEESFLNSDRPRIRGMTAKLIELGFK